MAAVVIAFGLVSASPAQAAVRTDWFSITKPEFDFGAGWLNNISGRPSSDGLLDWDLVDGKWEPRLLGRLFINNARGKCVQIQMIVTYQNGVTTTHTTPGTLFCAPDGSENSRPVDFRPVSSAYVDKVHFKLQSAPAGGASFTTEETTRFYFAPWWLP